jgi:hypothetical protein
MAQGVEVNLTFVLFNMVAYRLQHLALPLARPGEVFQWRARLPPRKCKHHKRQWIVFNGWRP